MHLRTPRMLLIAALASLSVSCSGESTRTLTEARAGHTTRLLQEWRVGEAPETPPKGVLQLTHYAGPLGAMAAYVSPDPGDGKRHPAIVWLVGGFSNSIGSTAWEPAPRENDQSARGFRARGIVMMYPSLRGGNTNPGRIEACYGEVDDVLAAAKHLAALPYVDPSRIYLGGHSTGGTLALLVAETGTTTFRAVFALGPAESVAGYGQEALPFDVKDPIESRLRAPIRWLKAIACPTDVFEGADPERSNIDALNRLRDANTNPLARFHTVPGATHFTLIAPWVEFTADQIITDTRNVPSLDFSRVTPLMKTKRSPYPPSARPGFRLGISLAPAFGRLVQASIRPFVLVQD